MITTRRKHKAIFISYKAFIALAYIVAIVTVGCTTAFAAFMSGLTIIEQQPEQVTTESLPNTVIDSDIYNDLYIYNEFRDKYNPPEKDKEYYEFEISNIEKEEEEIIKEDPVEETSTVNVAESTNYNMSSAPAADTEVFYSNNWTQEDFEYLLMAIVGEAQNCSWTEQMYVGSVVLNRYHTQGYGSIKNTVLAPNQYVCFTDGNAYKTPTETNIAVAKELLANGSVLPSNVLFQALGPQGDGVYHYFEDTGTYFCYVN